MFSDISFPWTPTGWFTVRNLKVKFIGTWAGGQAKTWMTYFVSMHQLWTIPHLINPCSRHHVGGFRFVFCTINVSTSVHFILYYFGKSLPFYLQMAIGLFCKMVIELKQILYNLKKCCADPEKVKDILNGSQNQGIVFVRRWSCRCVSAGRR